MAKKTKKKTKNIEKFCFTNKADARQCQCRGKKGATAKVGGRRMGGLFRRNGTC